MEPTLPDKPEAFNAEHITAMIHSAGEAFAQATQNQAHSVQSQSQANVRMAEIQATTQLEQARMSSATQLEQARMQIGNQRLAIKFGGVMLVLVVLILAGVIGGAFYTGHVKEALGVLGLLMTHVATGFGAYFAGRRRGA